MKWLPRSLGGQLVLLMLGGFVVGALFGTLGLWLDARSLHPIARAHALSRTVSTYHLAEHYPAGDQGWLEAIESPGGARVWVDHVPSEGGMDRDARSLAGELGSRLPARAVHVHMPCRDDAHGRPLRQNVGEADADVTCVEIDLGLSDGRWLHTRQFMPADSLWYESWRLLHLSLLIGIPPVLILMYIFVNRILRPTAALTDAAERMSRGERLKPLLVQGPNEIREIVVAFNQMHERISCFVTERTHMLAAISHDLRTPLTSLVLQAAMLPEGEERTEMLCTLEDISQMVHETLHFATQDARAEASKPIDLAMLLRDICSRPAGPGGTVSLVAPAQLVYACRPLALRRALGNLVENGLKHAHRVEVQLIDRGHHGLLIEVADNGPGIPEAMLDRVFEPFFQLDEARHHDSRSSIGLGLAIARDCVQAHGGQIRLHNREQGGLLARIELPAERRRLMS